MSRIVAMRLSLRDARLRSIPAFDHKRRGTRGEGKTPRPQKQKPPNNRPPPPSPPPPPPPPPPLLLCRPPSTRPSPPPACRHRRLHTAARTSRSAFSGRLRISSASPPGIPCSSANRWS